MIPERLEFSACVRFVNGHKQVYWCIVRSSGPLTISVLNLIKPPRKESRFIEVPVGSVFCDRHYEYPFCVREVGKGDRYIKGREFQRLLACGKSPQEAKHGEGK